MHEWKNEREKWRDRPKANNIKAEWLFTNDLNTSKQFIEQARTRQRMCDKKSPLFLKLENYFTRTSRQYKKAKYHFVQQEAETESENKRNSTRNEAWLILSIPSQVSLQFLCNIVFISLSLTHSLIRRFSAFPHSSRMMRVSSRLSKQNKIKREPGNA